MSIFPSYSFDLEVLYGGVDGQNLKPKLQLLKPDILRNTSEKAKA